MRKLALKDAQPDMILAKAVENAKGMVLCGPGKPLTEIMLERFANMGIEEIWIEGDEPLNAAQAAKAKLEIERRFSLAKDCPVGEMLKKIVLARLEKRMA